MPAAVPFYLLDRPHIDAVTALAMRDTPDEPAGVVDLNRWAECAASADRPPSWPPCEYGEISDGFLAATRAGRADLQPQRKRGMHSDDARDVLVSETPFACLVEPRTSRRTARNYALARGVWLGVTTRAEWFCVERGDVLHHAQGGRAARPAVGPAVGSRGRFTGVARAITDEEEVDRRLSPAKGCAGLVRVFGSHAYHTHNGPDGYKPTGHSCFRTRAFSIRSLFAVGLELLSPVRARGRRVQVRPPLLGVEAPVAARSAARGRAPGGARAAEGPDPSYIDAVFGLEANGTRL